MAKEAYSKESRPQDSLHQDPPDPLSSVGSSKQPLSSKGAYGSDQLSSLPSTTTKSILSSYSQSLASTASNVSQKVSDLLNPQSLPLPEKNYYRTALKLSLFLSAGFLLLLTLGPFGYPFSGSWIHALITGLLFLNNVVSLCFYGTEIRKAVAENNRKKWMSLALISLIGIAVGLMICLKTASNFMNGFLLVTFVAGSFLSVACRLYPAHEKDKREIIAVWMASFIAAVLVFIIAHSLPHFLPVIAALTPAWGVYPFVVASLSVISMAQYIVKAGLVFKGSSNQKEKRHWEYRLSLAGIVIGAIIFAVLFVKHSYYSLIGNAIGLSTNIGFCIVLLIMVAAACASIGSKLGRTIDEAIRPDRVVTPFKAQITSSRKHQLWVYVVRPLAVAGIFVMLAFGVFGSSMGVGLAVPGGFLMSLEWALRSPQFTFSLIALALALIVNLVFHYLKPTTQNTPPCQVIAAAADVCSLLPESEHDKRLTAVLLGYIEQAKILLSVAWRGAITKYEGSIEDDYQYLVWRGESLLFNDTRLQEIFEHLRKATVDPTFKAVPQDTVVDPEIVRVKVQNLLGKRSWGDNVQKVLNLVVEQAKILLSPEWRESITTYAGCTANAERALKIDEDYQYLSKLSTLSIADAELQNILERLSKATVDRAFRPKNWSLPLVGIAGVITFGGCLAILFSILTGQIGLAGMGWSMPLTAVLGFGSWVATRYFLNHTSGGAYTTWATIFSAVFLTYLAIMFSGALKIGSFAVAPALIALGLLIPCLLLFGVGYRHAQKEGANRKNTINTAHYQFLNHGLRVFKVVLIIGFTFLAFLSLATLFNFTGLHSIIPQLLGSFGLEVGVRWLSAFCIGILATAGFIAFELVRSVLEISPSKTDDTYERHTKQIDAGILLGKFVLIVPIMVGLLVMPSLLPAGAAKMLWMFLMIGVVMPFFARPHNGKYLFGFDTDSSKYGISNLLRIVQDKLHVWLGVKLLLVDDHGGIKHSVGFMLLREGGVIVLLGGLAALVVSFSHVGSSSAIPIVGIGIVTTLLFRWSAVGASYNDPRAVMQFLLAMEKGKGAGGGRKEIKGKMNEKLNTHEGEYWEEEQDFNNESNCDGRKRVDSEWDLESTGNSRNDAAILGSNNDFDNDNNVKEEDRKGSSDESDGDYDNNGNFRGRKKTIADSGFRDSSDSDSSWDERAGRKNPTVPEKKSTKRVEKANNQVKPIPVWPRGSSNNSTQASRNNSVVSEASTRETNGSSPSSSSPPPPNMGKAEPGLLTRSLSTLLKSVSTNSNSTTSSKKGSPISSTINSKKISPSSTLSNIFVSDSDNGNGEGHVEDPSRAAPVLAPAPVPVLAPPPHLAFAHGSSG